MKSVITFGVSQRSGELKTTTMKNELLLRIGAKLMDDYNKWLSDKCAEVLNSSGAFFGSVNDSAKDLRELIVNG